MKKIFAVMFFLAITAGVTFAGNDMQAEPSVKVISVMQAQVFYPILCFQHKDCEVERFKKSVRILASIWWNDGSRWIPITHPNLADYFLNPELAVGQYASAKFDLPSKGGDWIWVRFAGYAAEPPRSGKYIEGLWVWAKEESPYWRADDQARGGYEFLLNRKSGEIKPVDVKSAVPVLVTKTGE